MVNIVQIIIGITELVGIQIYIYIYINARNCALVYFSGRTFMNLYIAI